MFELEFYELMPDKNSTLKESIEKMGSYESQLRSGGVPSGEISIIVHNLEKLEGTGISSRSIGDVVGKIIKDSRFRASFIKDYRVATR